MFSAGAHLLLPPWYDVRSCTANSSDMSTRPLDRSFLEAYLARQTQTVNLLDVEALHFLRRGAPTRDPYHM
jgi:hypothetical protein